MWLLSSGVFYMLSCGRLCIYDFSFKHVFMIVNNSYLLLSSNYVSSIVLNAFKIQFLK